MPNSARCTTANLASNLLVGPDWNGKVPAGITKVFRARTNTGFVIPRVFQDDTSADRAAIQPSLSGVDMYPLSQYDGKVKHRDWAKLPKFPAQAAGSGQRRNQMGDAGEVLR